MICRCALQLLEEILLVHGSCKSASVLAGTPQSFPAMMSASSRAAHATAQLVTSNFCVLRMPDLKMNARHFQSAA
jgi:hypothetical protein